MLTSFHSYLESLMKQKSSQKMQPKKSSRKPKRTREELIASLPVFEVICDTKEEDRICDACGTNTRYLGKEHVRDEIEIIPEKMHIIRYI